MKTKLKESLKSAMKAQDRVRLDTIRSILTEIQYEEMQKGVEELSPSDHALILQRELKKRQESLQFEEQANRTEEKNRLLAEIAVIEGYLPKQLSAGDLEKIISDMKAATPGLTLNVVMKHLKESFTGQYDGKTASEVVKRVLG